VTIQAFTLVDKSKRTVTLDQIKILSGDFPSAPQATQEYVKSLRTSFPKELTGISLDRLESSFTAGMQDFKGPGKPLNNSPPQLIISMQPAVLVYVDGPPVYKPVAGTELQRVINSRALLLKDKSSELYVHVLDGYLKSQSLDGPWVATAAPSGAAEAEKQGAALPTPVDLLNATTDSSTNRPLSLTNVIPVVYVATK